MTDRQGFHCTHFDTALLRQIIEVDADVLAHEMQRTNGLYIPLEARQQWIEQTLQSVTGILHNGAEAHILLPQNIEEEIRKALQVASTPLAIPMQMPRKLAPALIVRLLQPILRPLRRLRSKPHESPDCVAFPGSVPYSPPTLPQP